MGELTIQGVTVSVELADKDFGNGTGRFVSLRGGYQNGVPLSQASFVIEDSLELFLAAWKSLLSSRFAQSAMTGDEFKEWYEKAVHRTNSAHNFLKRQEEAEKNLVSIPPTA